MQIEERFISGFCRTFNQTRTVMCEYTVVDGSRILEGADCAYARCEHRAGCDIARAMERGDEEK